MRWRYLAAALFWVAQGSALAGALPAQAQVQDQPPQPSVAPALEPEPQVQPAPDTPVAVPEASPPAGAAEATPAPVDQTLVVPPPSAPADPVVAIIRAKLSDPEIGKAAHADDLAALTAFYEARTGAACGSPRWASRPRDTRPCSRSRRPVIGVSTRPPSIFRPPTRSRRRRRRRRLPRSSSISPF